MSARKEISLTKTVKDKLQEKADKKFNKKDASLKRYIEDLCLKDSLKK